MIKKTDSFALYNDALENIYFFHGKYWREIILCIFSLSCIV